MQHSLDNIELTTTDASIELLVVVDQVRVGEDIRGVTGVEVALKVTTPRVRRRWEYGGRFVQRREGLARQQLARRGCCRTSHKQGWEVRRMFTIKVTIT